MSAFLEEKVNGQAIQHDDCLAKKGLEELRCKKRALTSVALIWRR